MDQPEATSCEQGPLVIIEVVNATTAKTVDENKDDDVDGPSSSHRRKGRSRSRSRSRSAAKARCQESGGGVCQLKVCSSQPRHVEPVDQRVVAAKKQDKKKPKRKRSRKIKSMARIKFDCIKMAKKKMRNRIKRIKKVRKVKEVKKKRKRKPAVVAKDGKKKTRKPASACNPRKKKRATRRKRLPAAASKECADPSTVMLHGKTPFRQSAKKLTMAARSKKKKETRKPASACRPRKKKRAIRRKRLPEAASKECAGV